MATFQLGGLIDIEDPTIDGVFPYLPDFEVRRSLDHPYVIHVISLKKEQRILTSRPGSTWTIGRDFMTEDELEDLYSFYDDHRKANQLFYFYDPSEMNCPLDDTGADETGRYTVRFKDDSLDFQAIRDLVFAGQLELIEVNTETDVQEIGSPLDTTVTPSRYPRDTAGGQYVLDMWTKPDLTGAMDIVPLVVIMPKEAGVTNYIHVSDRLCHIEQIGFGFTPTELHGDYIPRLLSWDVSQQIGEGDSGSFVFSNDDSVWDEYAKQKDLDRAIVELCFQTGGPQHNGQWTLKLWRGYIVDWYTDRTNGTFTIECEGGIHALFQKLPRRTASTTCPLQFNFGFDCPYDAVGSGGDPLTCDKGLDTPNGCIAHGMHNYFQGVVVTPQTATGLLPRNQGSIWSVGRTAYSSTSTPLKGITDSVIPLVYGDGRQIVEGKIFEYRDESEFKAASAIVSDGPIGSIGMVLLDGLAHHYVPGVAQPGVRALGAIAQDVGTIIDPAFRSSRLSFVSTRVNDEIGIQSAADNHTMLVEVLRGLQCLHTVAGSFDNHAFVDTSNPVIVAHDLVARAVGHSPYPNIDIQLTRQFRIDMIRYADAVAYCEEIVDSLVGEGTEKRFEFRGVLQEQKPAIEHIRDIAATAPIDVVYTFGTVAFKVRRDEINNPLPTQITFEHGENIILGSFRCRRWEPAFNEVKLMFADEDLDFKENSVTLYDEEAQKHIGFFDDTDWENNTPSKRPLVKQKQINLVGCFRKSQAARLGTQLLREELGGATLAEQLDARVVEFEAPLVGLAVEIGDVSKIVHPDLPNGEAYVRWLSWSFSNDWKVKLQGRTVTASMYSTDGDDAPPQLPSPTEGEVMNFPPLEVLTAPTLTVLSCNYSTSTIGVSARPQLTNYLVFQSATNNSFSGATEQVLPAASTTSVTIGGTAGVTQYFRAKWRRTLDPLEESDWSATVQCDFPKVAADDIDSVPTTECVAPDVPVIKAIYGWNEFLEVELLSGTLGEGCKVLYAGPLTSGAWPKGGLYVENTSSDPTIKIDFVEYYMGANPDHAAGFTSLDNDLLDEDPLPLARGTIAAATNITTLDTGDPGSPKRGVDYLQTFIGASANEWVRYVMIPESEGDPFNLVCPQDSELSENVPTAYHCDGGLGPSYFAVRLELTDFSAALRGVSVPRMEVAIYGRSGGAYSETLQRTFYDPFLPSHPWPGHDGSFFGNSGTTPGRIKVKFSSGLVLDRAVGDIANQGAGWVLTPTRTNLYRLDDFFVFVSEDTFTETLGASSGEWWEMLGNLPAGIHVARVARDTNLFITNIFGAKLQSGVSYHVRVGARRSTTNCITDEATQYLYSETLSEEQVQTIQTTSGVETPTDPGEPPTTDGAVLTESGQTRTLIAGPGLKLVEDSGEGTLSVELDQDSIRESGGFAFIKFGTAAVATNIMELVADYNGTFKNWSLRALTAPTGANLIADIHKNGTSIFANGALRPTLTAGSASATGTTFDLPAFVTGDVFRFDIDQIGSTVAGERIELQLNADSPLRLI